MLDKFVKTLMIIDEDKYVRDFLADEYSYLNVNIIKVKDGREAVEKIETLTVDLVLLPILLSDMSGSDLYKMAINKNPKIAFIYISDSDDKDLAIQLDKNVIGVIDFGIIQLKSMQKIVSNSLKL